MHIIALNLVEVLINLQMSVYILSLFCQVVFVMFFALQSFSWFVLKLCWSCCLHFNSFPKMLVSHKEKYIFVILHCKCPATLCWLVPCKETQKEDSIPLNSSHYHMDVVKFPLSSIGHVVYISIIFSRGSFPIRTLIAILHSKCPHLFAHWSLVKKLNKRIMFHSNSLTLPCPDMMIMKCFSRHS